VAARLSRDADYVHVVLDRLPRDLLGRLEEHAHVDVEAQIGEAVAITLAPRSWPSWPILATSMRGRRPCSPAKRSDLRAQRLPFLVVGELAAVDAGDGADLGVIAAHTFSSAPEISPTVARARQRRSRARGGSPRRSRRRAVSASRAARTRAASRVLRMRSSRANLGLAHGGVVDLADVDGRLLGQLELVHPDDHVSPRSMRACGARPSPRCGAWASRLDRLRHAAHRLDLLDDAEGLLASAWVSDSMK